MKFWKRERMRIPRKLKKVVKNGGIERRTRHYPTMDMIPWTGTDCSKIHVVEYTWFVLVGRRTKWKMRACRYACREFKKMTAEIYRRNILDLKSRESLFNEINGIDKKFAIKLY